MAPPTQETGPATNPNNIDLEAILLPQHEAHARENAQRVSAGVLAAQEHAAQLPKTALPVAPTPTPKTGVVSGTPPKQGHAIASLETYKGDVEKYVREKNISVAGVATAESRRANVRSLQVSAIAAQEEGAREARTHSWGYYASLFGGGLVCILLAVGVVYWVATRTGQLPIAPAPQAPFIAVDGVVDILVDSNEDRTRLLTHLEKEKEASTLSLGLIEQLRPIAASANQTNQNSLTLIGAQSFLSLLSPSIPPNLLRTLGQQFLLGAHSFSTPQPFLLLKTDSYEEAFSGMLAWEDTMRSDLLPLFAYTPSPHAGRGATPQTPDSTQTTTSQQNSLSQTGFTDAIVENHDARVLKNNAGDIYFLWTFLDRTTIVITTNEYTLREVISRLKDAPLLLQPGQ